MGESRAARQIGFKNSSEHALRSQSRLFPAESGIGIVTDVQAPRMLSEKSIFGLLGDLRCFTEIDANNTQRTWGHMLEHAQSVPAMQTMSHVDGLASQVFDGRSLGHEVRKRWRERPESGNAPGLGSHEISELQGVQADVVSDIRRGLRRATSLDRLALQYVEERIQVGTRVNRVW